MQTRKIIEIEPLVTTFEQPWGKMKRAFISLDAKSKLGIALPFDTIIKDIIKNRDKTNSIQAAIVSKDQYIALNDQGYILSEGRILGQLDKNKKGDHVFTTIGGKRKLIDIDPEYFKAEKTLAKILFQNIIDNSTQIKIIDLNNEIKNLEGIIKGLKSKLSTECILEITQTEIKANILTLNLQKQRLKDQQLATIEKQFSQENLDFLQQAAKSLTKGLSVPLNWEEESTKRGLIREAITEETGASDFHHMQIAEITRENMHRMLTSKTFKSWVSSQTNSEEFKTFAANVNTKERDTFAKTKQSTVSIKGKLKLSPEDGITLAFLDPNEIPKNANITNPKKGFWGAKVKLSIASGPEAKKAMNDVQLRGGAGTNSLTVIANNLLAPKPSMLGIYSSQADKPDEVTPKLSSKQKVTYV